MTFRGFLANRVALALALLLVPAALGAEVTRIEISSRSDVLDGKSFGEAGAYEQLVGKAFFAVDTRHPRNRIIVDLDKAPRNAKGLVEFSADLSILKPKDPSRGNGVLFFDIINRGNSVLLGTFNRGEGATPLGDEFLMREGYTLVTVGWETDVAEGRPRLVILRTARPDPAIVARREVGRSAGTRSSACPNIPTPRRTSAT